MIQMMVEPSLIRKMSWSILEQCNLPMSQCIRLKIIMLRLITKKMNLLRGSLKPKKKGYHKGKKDFMNVRNICSIKRSV